MHSHTEIGITKYLFMKSCRALALVFYGFHPVFSGVPHSWASYVFYALLSRRGRQLLKYLSQFREPIGMVSASRSLLRHHSSWLSRRSPCFVVYWEFPLTHVWSLVQFFGASTYLQFLEWRLGQDQGALIRQWEKVLIQQTWCRLTKPVVVVLLVLQPLFLLIHEVLQPLFLLIHEVLQPLFLLILELLIWNLELLIDGSDCSFVAVAFTNQLVRVK